LQSEFGELIPAKGKQFLEKVQSATDRMYSMIEGVLNYSTLNAGEQTIELIDLNEVIDRIEADLELSIQQNNATIRREKLPQIQGAHVLIFQLFYNLINNSIKFARTDAAPVITISASTGSAGNEQYARIIVADNGIGFDQQYAEKIFNTFTRLNAKDKYEGTGLGLALCKKIVERHHGTISADGEKHQGARFTITLPMVQTVKWI
jgi:light-regulated signal transduction histidine kinase (bacteriophytochrome)